MVGRPQMIWESVAWVVVALAAVPLMTLIEAPVKARWPSAWPALRGLAPWLIGLGPAYLALISGAVLGRSFGLYGRGGAAGWLVSTLFCAGLAAGTWGLRRHLANPASEQDLISVVMDEPRWALYRAAGVVWLGTWGLLFGLGVGMIEWVLRTRPWLAEIQQDRGTWLVLIRLGVSSLIFALTGNFWLTWTTQAVCWFLLSRVQAQLAHEP
jgi:hypothetical protein